MNYDDETLMAYADGELDETLSAEIAAAIDRDPVLARRVESHRALRAEVAGAFATVIDQPVPERLRAAASGVAPESSPQRRADVLQFPTRTATHAPMRAWGGREWGAMAASLVLGALLFWKFAPSEDASMRLQHGAMVARGGLAQALDQQLASTQRPEDPVQIGLTFRSSAGTWCRTFTLRDAATAGLACREGGEWRIPVTAEVQGAGEGMRQAASLPPPVMAEVETRRAGDAVDASGEQSARQNGWDAK